MLDQEGVALNYLPIVDLIKQGKQVIGVRARDAETGETLELNGKVIVNATGVFVDEIRRMDEPTAAAMLSPSQGVHLVVDKRFLPNSTAMMIPRTEDGRVLFAVPWHGKVVIGTTDTPVEQPSYEPRPLNTELDFILRTAARYLNPAPSDRDVLSIFVGQRPLVKQEGTASTATLSREHVIQSSASGLLTITGGKWTTYRKMGEDLVDRAVQQFNLPSVPSITANLHLHGWAQIPDLELLTVYGSDAVHILQLPGTNQLLHPQLPYLEAEVRWAARYELARTVEDVLARRTRSLFLNAQASIEAAPTVAAILAKELGQDEVWQHQQLQNYRTLATGYLLK